MFTLPSVRNSSQGCDGDRRARGLPPQLRAWCLPPQIEAVERGVASALAQQRLVTPRFDDRPILDDEDAIGVDDGMQTMRDHDGRSSLAQVLDRALNLPLGFRIERSRRLVEQNDRRVLEQGACDGDALALAARDLQAVLAGLCVVSAG